MAEGVPFRSRAAEPIMTHPPEHPYASFLDRVNKPARYTGGEVGARRKAWEAVQARICLAFPDVYDIGMSHLGFKILYRILNDDPRTLAERAYCPWVDMEAELRARDLPLISLDTHRTLADFDVVGFSLQFELTFTNILTMLDLGRIPLRSAARGEDDPLVVAGGPNATHPEPLADFIDAFCIGDGEAKLTEVALTWTELQAAGVPRVERLKAIAKLGAVYVPRLYGVAEEPNTGLLVVEPPPDSALPFPVERARVDINDYPFPDDGPTGGPEAIFDRTSIEITRGCTEGCRFCQAGMIYRPVQERDPQQVIDTVRGALKKSGNDEVSLTALSTADVSYIHPLIKALAPELSAEGISLSVSSLRAYGLAPELLDELKRLRTGGLTFAPEAGTERMRAVVNKNVTEAQLMETAERVFSRGWQKMKLYFMIGLPTEEDEDVRGIVETSIRTAQTGRRAAKKRVEVTVSVSTHVPKPHTPFQWAAMDPLAEIQRKQKMLRALAKTHKAVRLRVHGSETSVLEGIMARGDRRLGDVIERAWRNGARFDSWDEHGKLEVWEEALEHFEIETARYLGTLPTNATLPWDHIDVGLEDGFLLREYRKALRDRLSPPCGKVAGHFVHHTNVKDAEAETKRLVCYDCGVACDMTQMRTERLIYLRRLRAYGDRDGGDTPRVQPELSPGPLRGDPQAGQRYRFRFEKKGPVALLGHLDLVRELPRIFRRLGRRQMYTGGFKPKPDMTFSPALSLGAMSLDEYVDLRLEEQLDPVGLATLLAEMNAHAPTGLVFIDAVRLGPQDKGVAKVVEGARFAVAIARSVISDGWGVGRDEVDAWLAERCRVLLARGELPVQRKTKGIRRTIDVRPHLRVLRPLSVDEAAATFRRAGMAGNLVAVDAIVDLSNRGSIRTGEIATWLLTEDLHREEPLDATAPPPHRTIRLAVFGRDRGELVSPLDGVGTRSTTVELRA
ncbi:MAG: TIGR03960 family B12-binding radical SAM protein [Myxococcota bacterium]